MASTKTEPLVGARREPGSPRRLRRQYVWQLFDELEDLRRLFPVEPLATRDSAYWLKPPFTLKDSPAWAGPVDELTCNQ